MGGGTMDRIGRWRPTLDQSWKEDQVTKVAYIAPAEGRCMSLHLVLSVGTICALSTGRYGSPSVAHQLSHVLVCTFL
jgi:hypothetical protein